MAVSIVFSPHPDDESITCGGTILSRVRRGDDVHVVVMTDGRNSHSFVLGIKENPSPDALAIVRRNEAVAATAALGVPAANVRFLGVHDMSLTQNEDAAFAKVIEFLKELKPDEIYAPRPEDRHKDHSATSRIVQRAIEHLALDVTLREYLVWDDPDKLREFRAMPGYTFVDLASIVADKQRALDAYKSQFTTLFPSQSRSILDAAFIQRFLEREEFVDTRFRKGRRVGNDT
jgi:LmbE family N-acetylglucosaminyl deacetylase